MGAAGRKDIDSSGRSPVDRLSWIVGSKNQTGKRSVDACWDSCQLFTVLGNDSPWIPPSSTASGCWRLSFRYPADLEGGGQEGVCPLLGTTISVVTTQKVRTAGCASRQTIPWYHFSAILAKVVGASRNPRLKSITNISPDTPFR